MSTFSHYNKSIRKLTTAFASTFNNIFLIRYNEDGTENQRIVVPIVFADQEKYTKRIQGDPDLDRKVQITLPRMSYELAGMRYDPSRKLNTMNKNFNCQSDRTFYQYNPIPYDFDFLLTIYTRNIEDGNQILEQIIPYFTPDYTIKVNMVPELNMIRNIPIILNNISPAIDSNGLFNSETRTIYWTLQFSLKGYIFGSIKDTNIIKRVTVNINQTTSSDYLFDNSPGSFKENEFIYQGLSKNNATASAIVEKWNPDTNVAILSNINGFFIPYQPVVGETSIKLLLKSHVTHKISTIQQDVVPETANVSDPWTLSETITHYD